MAVTTFAPPDIVEDVMRKFLHDRYPGTENCVFSLERSLFDDTIMLKLFEPKTMMMYSKTVKAGSLHTDNSQLYQLLQYAAEALGYMYVEGKPPELPVDVPMLTGLLDLLK